MVYSSAPQRRETYELWKPFSMPVEGGSIQAVAVPSSAASYIVSLYTLLITSAVISLWGCLFGLFLRNRLTKQRPNLLYISMWNKRYSLVASVFEVAPFKGGRKKVVTSCFTPLLFITVGFLV